MGDPLAQSPARGRGAVPRGGRGAARASRRTARGGRVSKADRQSAPVSAGELVPSALKPQRAPVRRALADPFLVDSNAEGPILYQHSVLCQTCLPYRNPGEVRLWQRKNGIARLEVQAGRAYDGSQDAFVDVGLPYGPKPRLALYHLNAEAL